MSKTIRNVILFMEASGKNYETPQKSGNSFMNRFSVNEDASFEIIGIHHLETQQSLDDASLAIALLDDAAWMTMKSKKGTEIKKSKIFHLVFNFIPSLKSVNDKVTILNAIKSAAENQIQGYKSHFIFAGDIFWNVVRLRSVVIEGMKKYNINSAMMSILSSVRNNVTTKEKVEDHCKGKYEDKNSIHDDLDSFFERLCLGEEPNETVRTYFFPKLSEKETNLFETKDEEFMQTLADSYDLERIGSEQDTELLHYSYELGFCKIDSDLWTFLHLINLLEKLHLGCYAWWVKSFLIKLDID